MLVNWSLPSNISHKGERFVCLLFKATNGLRRAPLYGFISCREQFTFKTLLNVPCFDCLPNEGCVMICCSQHKIKEEEEAFLSQLQAIWKMKVAGRIPSRKRAFGIPR